MGLRGAIKKRVVKPVKKAVKKAAYSVPGYGGVAKTLDKQNAENKRTAARNRGR